MKDQFTRDEELEFIVKHAGNVESQTDKDQLKALWTSFCVKYGIKKDTPEYDKAMAKVVAEYYKMAPNNPGIPTMIEWLAEMLY